MVSGCSATRCLIRLAVEWDERGGQESKQQKKSHKHSLARSIERIMLEGGWVRGWICSDVIRA